MEKFPSGIHHVDFAVCKCVVQSRFQSGGILAENHRVNIKVKGNRCVAEFVHSFRGVEPTGHADLIHILAKGSDIGNDIDIAGTLVGFTVVDIADCTLRIGQFVGQFVFLFEQIRIIGVFQKLFFQLGQRVLIMLLFFFQLGTFFFQCLLDPCFFAHLGPEFLLFFLFFLFCLAVLIGKFQFFLFELEVTVGNRNIHHNTQFGDCVPAGVDPFL